MIVKSWQRLVLGAIAFFAAAMFALSFVWPFYEWNLVVPSPDHRRVIIVLRGDAAAFSDFSYRIYVFPISAAPVLQPSRTPQLFTWPWRGNRYLAYDGPGYPMFRWTGIKTMEIDFNELSPSQMPADTRFSVGGSEDGTVVSLRSGVEHPANAMPD